jgi:4-hydroxybenzoate polyprenyltransferase
MVWSAKNRNLHRILLAAGVFLILFSLFSFHLHHFIILGILGVIAFLYSFPIIPFGKKKRIKDYGFMKIITLSLLWTLVTVWFPVVNFSIEKNIYAFVFIKRFVFMFTLCLAFDIRDIEIDGKENINTIAVILGKKKSYILIYILLGIFIFLSTLQFFYFADGVVLFAMVISAIITFFTVEITKKTSSDFFYLAGLDGLMLIQTLLVYLLGLLL